MSGWIVTTRALYDIGGGPARFREFRNTAENRNANCTLADAIRNGAIRRIPSNSTRNTTYVLTPEGEGLMEGRYRVGRHLGSKRLAIVPVIANGIPDELINALMVDARREAGALAGVEDVLRSYSNKLAGVVRHEALTT